MKAQVSPPKSVVTEDPDLVTIEEQVRARAYELFEARGRELGRELEDWLRAEQEVNDRRSHASAA